VTGHAIIVPVVERPEARKFLQTLGPLTTIGEKLEHFLLLFLT